MTDNRCSDSAAVAAEDAPSGTGVYRVASDPPRKRGEIDQLDDLAISGDLIEMLRLERMSDTHFWGRVSLKDGGDVELCFWSSRKVWAGVEVVAAEPSQSNVTNPEPPAMTAEPATTCETAIVDLRRGLAVHAVAAKNVIDLGVVTARPDPLTGHHFWLTRVRADPAHGQYVFDDGEESGVAAWLCRYDSPDGTPLQVNSAKRASAPEPTP